MIHSPACTLFSLPLARAVLLSALVCAWNFSPISFRMACVKINSGDSAPRAFNSDSSWTVPYTRWSREIGQHSTMYNKCFSSSLRLQPSQSQSIPRCFTIPCRSRWVSMMGSSSGDSCVVFLSSISEPSSRVSNLQVLAARVCMTDILPRTEDPFSPQ